MTPGLGILCSILLSYGRRVRFISVLRLMRQGAALGGSVLALSMLGRPASSLEIAAGGGVHLDGRDAILADIVVPAPTEIADTPQWHVAADRGHDRWQRALVTVTDQAGGSLAMALVAAGAALVSPDAG